MHEISEIVIIHKMAADIYLCSDFYLELLSLVLVLVSVC